MADDRYRGALEATIEEIDVLLADLADKKQLANKLAIKAGVEPPYSDIEAPGSVASAKTIRADQFANFGAPSVAARAFLEMRGSAKGAVGIDVIFDALTNGGYAFGSTASDAKSGLRIALGKDAQVRRLPNGTYGLWDWYPNVKHATAKPKKNGDSPGAGESSSGNVAAADAPPEDPCPVPAAGEEGA